MISGIAIGIVLGALLLIGLAWGIDEYGNWKYRLQQRQEFRERPKIPHKIDKIELWRGDGGWYAHGYDRKGERLEPYGAGDHPMDAVADIIREVEE